MLVGTASVEDSEALSRQLTNIGVFRMRVLNARNDEAEAAIMAKAGAIRGGHNLNEHGWARNRHSAGRQPAGQS